MQSELLLRVIFLTILVLALVISGYYRSRARRLSGTIPRRSEGTLPLLLRVISGLTFLVLILLHAFVPHWMVWSTFDLPLWVRWVAAAVGLLCLPFLLWVFTSIGANISETVLTKSEHQLVRHGPYKWIRHPLYTSGLLVLLALSIIVVSWLMLVLWIVGALIMCLVVVPREEHNLVETFGQQYEEYRQCTGALLPRVR